MTAVDFLSEIIAPLTKEFFINELLSKHVPYIFRNTPASKPDSSSQVSWIDIYADLEELFMNSEKREYLSLHAARSNRDHMIFFFKDRQVPNSLLLHPDFVLANQCSVVINRADFCSDKIALLCENLAQDSFPFVYANVYITPPASRTVPPHSDDRDVFIFQAFGKKEWKVWAEPPVPFPFKEHEVGKVCPVPDTILEKHPIIDTVLEPGDVLFIPRGLVHVANTSDTSSLHITMALGTSHWTSGGLILDYLQQQLREVNDAPSEASHRLRQSISLPLCLSQLQKKSDLSAQQADLAEAMQNFLHIFNPDRVLNSFENHILQQRQYRDRCLAEFKAVPGGFRTQVSVDLDTKLWINPCVELVQCTRLKQGCSHQINAEILPHMNMHIQFVRKLAKCDPIFLNLVVSQCVADAVQCIFHSHKQTAFKARELEIFQDDLQKICFVRAFLEKEVLTHCQDQNS